MQKVQIQAGLLKNQLYHEMIKNSDHQTKKSLKRPLTSKLGQNVDDPNSMNDLLPSKDLKCDPCSLQCCFSQRNAKSQNHRQRHKKNLANFQKQYYQLVNKFKKRGFKFYNLISRLTKQNFDKDKLIVSLEQKLTEKLNTSVFDTQSSSLGNSSLQEKIIKTKQTHQNCVMKSQNNSQIGAPSMDQSHNKTLQEVTNKKLQTSRRISISAYIQSKTDFQQTRVHYLSSSSQQNNLSNLSKSSREVVMDQTLTNSIIVESSRHKQDAYRDADADEFNYQQNLLKKDEHNDRLFMPNVNTISTISNQLQKPNIQFDNLRQQNTKLLRAFIKISQLNRNLNAQKYYYNLKIKQQATKISSLQRMCNRMSQSLGNNSATLEVERKQSELTQQIVLLSKQIQNYQKNKLNSDSQIADLEQKIQQIQKLNQQIQTLGYKLGIVYSRYKEADNLKVVLQQKVKQKQKQVHIISIRLKSLQQQNHKLKKNFIQQKTYNHSQSQTSLQRRSEEASSCQLRSIIKFYQEQTSKSNKTISQLKVQLSDKNNQISYLKRSIQTINIQFDKKIRTYQGTDSSNRNRILKMSQKIERMQNQTKQLEFNNRILSQQWEKHKQNENFDLEELVNKLTLNLTVANVKIKDIQVQNRDLRSSFQCTLQQSRLILVKYKKQKKYNEMLQERIKQLQVMENNKNQRSKQIMQLQEMLKDAETQLCRKAIEIHYLSNLNKCRQESCQQAIYKNQVLNRQINDLREQISELKRSKEQNLTKRESLEFNIDHYHKVEVESSDQEVQEIKSKASQLFV